ncbi:uncharacterized protein RSE6_13584 [Rhynchosporium secalis]|uniref:Cytochrome P450 n=1 Tax=Rhynchosporium secalis TaxID=38038 RepID=A0A1E1MU12_RHYSE|nr:uncharacterized protein RSE6_13584 [Rhynchosporium secalis]
MSSAEIRKERHAVRYLHKGVEFDSTSFFLGRVAGDSLNRKLDMIQSPMYEELSRKIDEVFGVSEDEWKTINVYNSMQEIIVPAMSRVFFGLPLGLDPGFLVIFQRYVLAMGVGTIVIGELPRVLKGLLVPIFNIPLRYYRSKVMRALVPEVESRLKRLGNAADQKDGENGYDFITQSATVSAKMSKTAEIPKSNTLAEWIMLMGFAALSSTIIQASNLILDVICCPPEMEAWSALRDEAANSIKKARDWNDSSIFKRMPLLDSTIRESLRYHPILIKGLTKEVVHPEGLVLPDGTQVPRGSWLGVPVLGLHMDDRFYPNARTYDPFRFARLKAERAKEEKDIETRLNSNSPDRPQTATSRTRSYANELSAGQPTATYLGFGYGRHACPGRWFAVQVLKIMMAYMILNYDIEHDNPRPQTRVIGDAALPPISATIRVRRRRRTERT